MAGGFAKPIHHTGKYLEGRELIWPLSLIISLFFLWGFSYGLLDVLNSHFQKVLGITKLESTGLQVAYFGGGYFVFSPIAAEVMKRFGYKKAICMGLTLYSLGAIMFWPTAHFSSATNKRAAFGGFVACTFVIACGLATLETAANSYATVIGNPKTAARRLQFCQSWNGVASFIGPLIASHAFFNGANENSLTNVQYVYLAVACAGTAVNILFICTRMPEVSEELLQAMADAQEGEAGANAHKSFWKQYNMLGGFIAQFTYVGAQVTVATFFINYVNENGGYSKSRASLLLSMSLLIFTIARFIGTALLTWIAPDFLLLVYASMCLTLSVLASVIHGTGGVACVMIIFFFMSVQYPIIFVLGTEKLGRHTRRGSGLLVMGVAGGAVFPPIQGAIADAGTTRISYLAPAAGFCAVIAYALIHFLQNGRHVLKPKEIVPAAGVDEEYAYDTTIVPSSIGGVVAQPLSKVRTIEESRNDIKEDQLDEKF